MTPINGLAFKEQEASNNKKKNRNPEVPIKPDYLTRTKLVDDNHLFGTIFIELHGPSGVC